MSSKRGDGNTNMANRYRILDAETRLERYLQTRHSYTNKVVDDTMTVTLNGDYILYRCTKCGKCKLVKIKSDNGIVRDRSKCPNFIDGDDSSLV